MKKQIRITSIFSLIALLGAAVANTETPYPLGTSDLVRDQRLNEFIVKEEIKIEPIRWAWNAESVELTYEGSESSLSQFKSADQVTVNELQAENHKLKQRVDELELRLSKLEELLSDKERSSR